MKRLVVVRHTCGVFESNGPDLPPARLALSARQSGGGCSAWLLPERYERRIERHHTTDGEREAIAAAEHLDYDRYLPPRANILDSERLDRLDAMFRSIKAESGSVESLSLRYTASATWFPAMEFEVASDDLMITVDINGERVLSEMELYLFDYSFVGHDDEGQWRLLISPENWLEWTRLEGPILEKTIKGAYLVSMDIVYDEFHDPFAGYGYTCRQILVMDGNFNVVAMIVSAVSVVS